MATNNGYYSSQPYENHHNSQYNGQHVNHGFGGNYNQSYPSPPPYHANSQPTNLNMNHPYTHGVAPASSLPTRHPRLLFFISITRPWAIVIPFIALVMDAWWFSTGRLCGTYDATSDCYLVLWYSMPIAVVSLVWSIATTISSRRIVHHRPSIPSRIQLPLQIIVAMGATACLALLAVHLANSDWIRYNSLQGGIIALVAMITLVNWLLVGFAGYEWNLDRKYQQQSDDFVS